MKALAKAFQYPYRKARKNVKLAGYNHLNASTGSTLQACHFAPMFGISLRAWQTKAETVSFQWKKKRVWISAARQKLWSILWEHWLCFFSLCIKIRLDLLTENGPKRFLVLTHCLQMAITRLSFEISLITFFSLKDECHASTSKQKVQSSVARLEYEKKKIGEPTARRTLYNTWLFGYEKKVC